LAILGQTYFIGLTFKAGSCFWSPEYQNKRFSDISSEFKKCVSMHQLAINFFTKENNQLKLQIFMWHKETKS